MGKTTKIHPVGLNVLKGAAEFGGFKLGRIRQESCDEAANVAYYRTEILVAPANCGRDPNELRGRLNDLYSRDVLWTAVSIHSSGVITARLITGDFDDQTDPKTVDEAVKSGLLSVDEDGIPF